MRLFVVQIISFSILMFVMPIGKFLNAQDSCITYKLIPHTSYKSQPSTVSGLINETVMEPQRVTTYKPVWTRETRQRTTTVLKPIVKTSERVERYLVKRPIIETSYRERNIEETSYETVTEYQEQRYLVEKPVIETRMREEKVLVRKPVTSTMIQTENVTTLKPVTFSETQYVAGANIRNDLVLLTGRNRLRWLRPGFYTDPFSGLTDYKRRGGLHWVPDQALAVQPTIEPTLIPHQVTRTAYTPETVQVRKPVQVTQYVDQIETRKVPIQVSSTSRRIEVLKIPVTVRKPVTKIKTERIPIQEVKYREEVYERRVPVTETTYQKVEQIEPFEVEICKWVAETKEIHVPKTVTRRVNYSVNQLVPETTWMRVPVDPWGNVVATPEVVARQSGSPITYQVAERIRNAPIVDSSFRQLNPTVDISGRTTVVGKPIIVRKLSDLDAEQLLSGSTSPNSVLVPESGTGSEPVTDTVEVQKRPIPERTDDGEADSDSDANSQPTDPKTEADRKPTLLDVTPESETTLEIDSSDDADITERPDRSNDENGVELNGSN